MTMTVFSRETFEEGGQLYCHGGRGNKEMRYPGNERYEYDQEQKFKDAKRLYITVGKVFKEYVHNDGTAVNNFPYKCLFNKHVFLL